MCDELAIKQSAPSTLLNYGPGPSGDGTQLRLTTDGPFAIAVRDRRQLELRWVKVRFVTGSSLAERCVAWSLHMLPLNSNSSPAFSPSALCLLRLGEAASGARSLARKDTCSIPCTSSPLMPVNLNLSKTAVAEHASMPLLAAIGFLGEHADLLNPPNGSQAVCGPSHPSWGPSNLARFRVQ